jgi:cytochrome c
LFAAVAALVGIGAGILAVAADRQQARERRAAIARDLTGGDPGRAPAHMRRFGCAGCHTIPGIPGANGMIGPDLRGVASRFYFAGRLSNTPEQLIEWIVDPRGQDPRTTMPASGISRGQARDVAAWLYAQAPP